jgi:hypothetical protein
VIQRNAFFAHPENIILAMLGDERQSVREAGLKLILKARSIQWPSTVRKFIIPKLIYTSTEYFEIIDWNDVHEPPATLHLSDGFLEEVITTGSHLRTKVFNFISLAGSVEYVQCSQWHAWPQS